MAPRSTTKPTLRHCARDPKHKMLVPPPLEVFFMSGSDVVPDQEVDRDRPRCPTCDFDKATKGEKAAWERYSSGDIDDWVSTQTSRLRRGDISSSEYKALMVNCDDLKARTLKYRQGAVFLAWMAYWAIWTKPSEHNKYPLWPEQT